MIRGALENAAETKEARIRVPSGDVDRPLFVTLEDDARLDIREHRGSPSELADKEYAFHATQRGVRIERHYAPVLVEAIARAAGFSIMIRETNRAAA